MNINKAQNELEVAEEALNHAIEDGDADKAISYTKNRDELKEKLLYLKQIKEKTAAMAPFTSNQIDDEWAKICNANKAEWDKLFSEAENAAEQYRKATKELLNLHRILSTTKQYIETIARNNDFWINLKPVMTRELNLSKCVISKDEGKAIEGVAKNNI